MRYQSAAGGGLVLTVDLCETLAGDKTLATVDHGGRTFYTRPNQPHTLGVQVEEGPALWLSSVFPDAYTPYTEDDPRAELSGEELAALLTEVSGVFSTAQDPAALYHGGGGAHAGGSAGPGAGGRRPARLPGLRRGDGGRTDRQRGTAGAAAGLHRHGPGHRRGCTTFR